jgi:PAS domain S-box-containing protein
MIGSILTFLTILLTFYQQVAVPMYNVAIKPVVDLMTSIYQSPKRLSALESSLGGKLDEIIKELKPNGGSSIKDQLNRLETAVSISQAERLLLLDSIPQGVFTSDTKGRWLWVNDALRKTVGGSLAEFVGNNWENTVSTEDRETVVREWTRAVEQRRDFNLYFNMTNLDTNETKKVHVIATPANNFNNEIIGWNGVVHFV